jgi:predicted Rossmann-fold nucleotide-binding protein
VLDLLVHLALGRAIAGANRTLVYGGGAHGLMGITSGAALNAGGRVLGVVPYAMATAGGEGQNVKMSLPVSGDAAEALGSTHRDQVSPG